MMNKSLEIRAFDPSVETPYTYFLDEEVEVLWLISLQEYAEAAYKLDMLINSNDFDEHQNWDVLRLNDMIFNLTLERAERAQAETKKRVTQARTSRILSN